MSRATYMREYRARRKAMLAHADPGTRIVIGDDSPAFYLARIAELEEEVRILRAELARRAAPGVVGVGEVLGETPILVTADGTQGIKRGVSDGPSRRIQGSGAKR